MAAIKDLLGYERAFVDALKPRGYKVSIMTDGYTRVATGVNLEHPDKPFRFQVVRNSFIIQTSTEREVYSYLGKGKKSRREWRTLRDIFTNEELTAYRSSLTVPTLDDGNIETRVQQAIQGNDEEYAMREVRRGRRSALREAAPAMWRALSLITSDKIDRGLLEDADPKALQQCLEALGEAGEQDVNDLSIAPNGFAIVNPEVEREKIRQEVRAQVAQLKELINDGKI